MRTQISKEHGLKVALLVALAGCWSGHFSVSPEGQKVETVELASQTEMVQGPPAVPNIDQNFTPLSKSPNGLSPATKKIDVQPVPVMRGSGSQPSVKAPEVKAPVVANTDNDVTYTGKIKICDRQIRVAFKRLVEGGQEKTRITMTELVQTDDGREKFNLEFKILKSPKDNGIVQSSPDADAKAVVDQIVSTNGRKKLKEMGHCEEIAKSEPASSPREANDDDDAPVRRRGGRRVGAGPRDLRSILNKISKLGDIDEEKPTRARARAERELERIVKNELRPSLKALLMRRGVRGDEAQEMVNDAIEEIEAVGADAQLDSRQINRLTSSLRGLRYGAELYNNSLELSEDVKALREDYEGLRAQGQSVSPDQMQSYQEKLQRLQFQIQQEITSGPYAQMSQYRSNMNVDDMTFFSKPYENLQRDLQMLVNPQMSGAPMTNGAPSPFTNPQQGGPGGFGPQLGRQPILVPMNNVPQMPQMMPQSVGALMPQATGFGAPSPMFGQQMYAPMLPTNSYLNPGYNPAFASRPTGGAYATFGMNFGVNSTASPSVFKAPLAR